MIAKHMAIRSKTAGGPGRLIEYLTDDQGKKCRVAGFHTANMAATEPEEAVAEMQMTQQANSRAGANKMYHLTVSFAPGERPDAVTLETIENEICRAIGYGDHQRAVVLHDDTDCLHLQIAINKVHPTTLRCVTPKRDYVKLRETCERLEKEFGLTRTGLGRPEERPGSAKAEDMEHFSGRESMARWIKRAFGRELRAARTWEEFQGICAAHGLAAERRGGGLVLTNGEIYVKASAVDKGLAMSRMEALLGPCPIPKPERTAPPRPEGGRESGGPSDSEVGRESGRAPTAPGNGRRGGGPAAASPLGPAFVEALKAAPTWDDFLEVCRGAGVGFRKKGNGFVLVTESGDVKLSSLDRALGRAGLESRLGAFVPRRAKGAGEAEKKKGYEKAPPEEDRDDLYESYLAWKESVGRVAVRERRAAKALCGDRIRAAKAVYLAELRLAGRDPLARAACLEVYKNTVAICRLDYKKESAAVSQANRRLSWVDWLRKTAMAGGADGELALVALRRRAKGLAWKNTQAMTGEGEPRTVYDPMARIDAVTRNGTVIYSVGEELVRDNGVNFWCSGRTTKETLVAVLQMAKRRYGEELEVNGDHVFKERVVRAAVEATISGELRGGVTFKDPEMESARRRLLASRVPPPRPKPPVGRTMPPPTPERGRPGRDDGREGGHGYSHGR